MGLKQCVNPALTWELEWIDRNIDRYDSIEHGNLVKQNISDRYHHNKLKQLTQGYRSSINAVVGIEFSENRFGDKTSLNHLKWMLDEIDNNPDQTMTKKHRWFGFVQGLVIAYGITTVDQERDKTRNLLAGD